MIPMQRNTERPWLRQDPPRNETRARLSIRLHPEHASVKIPGYDRLIKHRDAKPDGTIEVTVYGSDVAKVLALVEPNADRWEAAKIRHEKKLREYVAKNVGLTPSQIPENREQRNEDMRRLESFYDGSPEAEFHADQRRGHLPLISADVVEADLAPPGTEDEQVMTRILGKLSDQMAASQADMMRQLIRAEMAAAKDGKK